jgi:hypothetical protein
VQSYASSHGSLRNTRSGTYISSTVTDIVETTGKKTTGDS